MVPDDSSSGPSSPSSPSSAAPLFDQALRSLGSFHPVRLSLSPDDTSLTATLQPAYLDKGEREAIASRLRPLRFRWNGSRFVSE